MRVRYGMLLLVVAVIANVAPALLDFSLSWQEQGVVSAVVVETPRPAMSDWRIWLPQWALIALMMGCLAWAERGDRDGS